MINKITAVTPIDFKDYNNPLLMDNNVYRPRILRCGCGNLPITEKLDTNDYEIFCEGCNTFLKAKTKFDAHYQWNMIACAKFDENEYFLRDLGIEFDEYDDVVLANLIEYRDSPEREFLSNKDMKALIVKIEYYKYLMETKKLLDS